MKIHDLADRMIMWLPECPNCGSSSADDVEPNVERWIEFTCKCGETFRVGEANSIANGIAAAWFVFGMRAASSYCVHAVLTDESPTCSSEAYAHHLGAHTGIRSSCWDHLHPRQVMKKFVELSKDVVLAVNNPAVLDQITSAPEWKIYCFDRDQYQYRELTGDEYGKIKTALGIGSRRLSEILLDLGIW